EVRDMNKHPSIRVVGLVAVCMMIWFVTGCGNNGDRQMLEQQDIRGTYDRAIDGDGRMQRGAQDGYYDDGANRAFDGRITPNNGNRMNDTRGNKNGTNEYEVAEAAADRVAKLDFV